MGESLMLNLLCGLSILSVILFKNIKKCFNPTDYVQGELFDLGF